MTEQELNLDLRTLASGAIALGRINAFIITVLIEIAAILFVLLADPANLAKTHLHFPRPTMLIAGLIFSVTLNAFLFPALVLCARGVLNFRLGWFVFAVISSFMVDGCLFYNVPAQPLGGILNIIWSWLFVVALAIRWKNPLRKIEASRTWR